MALYGQEPNVFRGAAHDIALLVAAQGGIAMHNAARTKISAWFVQGRIAAAAEFRPPADPGQGIGRPSPLPA
jgi:hypothetical protein